MSTDDLPPEILLQILSFLAQEDLASALQTCKTLHSLSLDSSLYKTLYFTRLPPANIISRQIARSLHHATSLILDLEARDRLIRPSLLKTILEGISSSTTIRHIDFHELQLNATVMASFFSRLDPACGLQRVVLTHTRLPEEPLLVLINRHGRTIRHLDLEFTEMTGNVLDAIWKHCYDSLVFLSLAGCFQIGSEALERFCGELPENLKRLDLRWNWDFNPDFFTNGLRNLEELDIRGCELTVEDIEDLKDKLETDVKIWETASEAEAVINGGWIECLKTFGCAGELQVF